MNKVYEINDLADLQRFSSYAKDITKIFQSKEFKEFIAKKCVEEIKKFGEGTLSEIPERDVANSEIKKYQENHKYEVGSDYIKVYNDTMADLSHLSEATLANYPDGLSVAQLIEYGMGMYGSPQEDYETQVNPNRDYSKEWKYHRNGNWYTSIGMNGKFIYAGFLEYFDQYFAEWVDEYMNLLKK